MKCLALDTTTDVSSIALADESGLIAEYSFAHHMDLSRRLMPNIVALLTDCGMEIKDVEAIGVSIGPGSFTGLRIGVVTAKTLAQALSIPIAGVVTLDLLAHQFDYLPGTVICPLIKVRKGEVYYAFYRTTGAGIERITEYDSGPIAVVIECALSLAGPSGRPLGEDSRSAVSSLQSPVSFCGDALADNLFLLLDALGDRVVPSPAWLSYPKASILARLALEKISAGDADDPISLVPFYIRKSAPEERLAGQ
jgi:tRNA threonylcarbamoyladenosine biosynthesis protein TsaB